MRDFISSAETGRALALLLESVARETQDNIVTAYYNLMTRDPGHWDVHVALMARVQAEHARYLHDIATRPLTAWPPRGPILFHGDRPGAPPVNQGCEKWTGFNTTGVWSEEWKDISGYILPTHRNIYFRDWVRSLWRRLTGLKHL